MKKLLALLLSITVVAATFAACGSKDSSSSGADSSSSSSQSENSDDSVKTGLAVISSASNSKDAGEADGVAEVNSTVVAVTVDNKGKIVKCAIDAAQTKINFSKDGKIVTDLASEIKSKNELGDNYGMKKASSIGKEWYEQAQAFADYVTGKTVEEVKGIALTEKGTASDKDLASSVTISIGGYINAIEKAVANAKDLGAKASDKIGLGITTSIQKSKDAGEKDGVAQAYSTYTVSTFDKDGTITSCVIDASQTDVNFSATGAITSDLTSENKTKNELGDDYGMKKASSIGKEWYEQAEALAKYVTGKKVADVKGIAVTDKGTASDEDLASSVTISIGDYINVIEKAGNNAK